VSHPSSNTNVDAASVFGRTADAGSDSGTRHGHGATTRIASTAGLSWPDFREVWRYRNLLLIFAVRDVRLRYKQTVLGPAWTIIQPFMAMILLTLFFGRLIQVPSDGVPYPVFAFSALLPWQFFSRCLNETSTCLAANQGLISKVYFPRLILPLAIVTGASLDFGVAFLALLAMLLWYGIAISWTILLAPLFVLLALLTALGAGLWFASLDAFYRDVRYFVGYLVQVWFFATPIVYPLSLIPEKLRFIYEVNPLVGAIVGFRWAVLGTTQPPNLVALAISCVLILVTLASGIVFFRRVERDVIDKV